MFTPAVLLYFTASAVPTGPETTAIETLQNDGRYSVFVRNATGKNYEGGEPEAADFVAGTIPTAYADAGDYPVIDPSALPDPTNIPATSKVIRSGVEFAAPAATGSYANGYTPTIVGGAVTAIAGS